MEGNDESIIKKIKTALGRCLTRRCRRIRRALGQNVNNSNNERNAPPPNRTSTRKRRSSMTPEEIEAANQLLRNRLAKQEAELKAERNKAWMDADLAHWRSEPITFRTAENIAREEAMIKEITGEAEAERQEAERQRRLNEEAEYERKLREERLRKLREEERVRRLREEIERQRRLREEEERKRKLEEEEERRRKLEEEEERRKRMAAPAEKEEERCQNLLIAEGLIILNDDNSARAVRQRFRKWTLSHHPNRGGDNTLFQEVSNCMDVLYRAAGGKRKTKRRKSTK